MEYKAGSPRVSEASAEDAGSVFVNCLEGISIVRPHIDVNRDCGMATLATVAGRQPVVRIG